MCLHCRDIYVEFFPITSFNLKSKMFNLKIKYFCYQNQNKILGWESDLFKSSYFSLLNKIKEFQGTSA